MNIENESSSSMRERYRKVNLLKACKEGIEALKKMTSERSYDPAQVISLMEKAIADAGESEEFLKGSGSGGK